MEELEDDPSSEMLAIELYRPAVYAARTFDLLYLGYLRMYVYYAVSYSPPLLCLIQVPWYLLVLAGTVVPWYAAGCRGVLPTGMGMRRETSYVGNLDFKGF